jgi:colicin import membrane protein
MRRAISRNPGWLRAALYALALHAAVIAMLVVGFRIVSRDEPTHGPVMQAVVVREPPPDAAAQERAKREEERQRREAEAQRVSQEQQRKDAERVRLETERKQQAVEAEKKQREAERRKEQKQRQQQTEQELREQLAEEEKNRAAARATRIAPEADKYKAAIRQKVSRQWVRPAASRPGLQCTVRVRLVPGGEVLEAKVVSSSGDAVFDRSVESAVYKAAPLPLPEDAELFERFREIEFVFRPEE